MLSLPRCLGLHAAALAAALMLPAGCANYAPMHDTAGQTMPLPVASSVADSYFGTSVDDPYRALEDLGSRATQDWMRLAAAHAQATLARIPGRQALRQRLAALSAGAPVTVERVLRLSRSVTSNACKCES